MNRPKILVAFGTRPEAIKMAPVIKELERCKNQLETLVVSTGQHRKMLDQVTDLFGISTDVDLSVMTENQTLASVTAKIITEFDRCLEEWKPDCVLVQGDTTTVFSAALASFYRQIPVGHVEAGLRTGDRLNPFPEEMNRLLATRLANFHFAPTKTSEAVLKREGVNPNDILVSGNTVIDALQWVVSNSSTVPTRTADANQFRILVTAHRRENLGDPMHEICNALIELVNQYPQVKITFPVHLNPNVRAIVFPMLDSIPNIRLVDPLSYLDIVKELAGCDLVLTDSGGIQEEAPSLGKPVLVMRNETERVEGIVAGTCKLVGPNRERLVRETRLLIENREEYDRMSKAVNPYGDGHAAERIVSFLIKRLAE